MNAITPIQASCIEVDVLDTLQLFRRGSTHIVHVPKGRYKATVVASEHASTTVYWLCITYNDLILGKPFRTWESYLQDSVEVWYGGESIESMSSLPTPS